MLSRCPGQYLRPDGRAGSIGFSSNSSCATCSDANRIKITPPVRPARAASTTVTYPRGRRALRLALPARPGAPLGADRRGLGPAPGHPTHGCGAAWIPRPDRPSAPGWRPRWPRCSPNNTSSAGWQGRLAFGPRALGRRSILAHPGHAATRDRLDAIEKRATYRPFAPAVLAEHATEWFMSAGAPFMNRVARVRRCRADRVAAVTHHDGTARVQSVAADHQGLHELLELFHERTGLPLLLNTSFNRKTPRSCGPPSRPWQRQRTWASMPWRSGTPCCSPTTCPTPVPRPPVRGEADEPHRPGPPPDRARRRRVGHGRVVPCPRCRRPRAHGVRRPHPRPGHALPGTPARHHHALRD
nr:MULTISPECIES: carbamoyltransferase C-terminal domain-containing protein [unclassified Streptomyces]